MVPAKRAKTWPDGTSSSSDTHSDAPKKSVSTDDPGYVVNDLKIKSGRRFYATRRFIFPLGICFGVLMAFILIQPSDIQGMHAHLSLLLAEYDITVPRLPDFDFSRVEDEWRKLKGRIPDLWNFNGDRLDFQVGESMKARGLTAQHPIVLIPGVVSTGLESWSTSPDYRAFFREKLWGGFHMLSQVTFNRDKWIEAMMLDPITGLDPPGAKIRAAQGIDAASSFIQGFWIWSKIVENLAVIGYDTNNLYLAPYDWRLSYYNLEIRDGYFSRLKSTIEGLTQRKKKKVVIAAHSMGATILLYFFKWVESRDHGGGGPDWVENHIAAYISIAGTHLGVPKAMAAFLSGEMKDTVQMNPAGAYVLERFFSRQERQRLFRSWAGSASLWIKGGDAVWGNGTHSPEDEADSSYSHGELIAFRKIIDAERHIVNMTADQAGSWILEHTPLSFQQMIASNYSFGFERDDEQLVRNDQDFRKWTNPLEVRLPYAPSMKMYCVYGHGKETERSYWYTSGNYEYDESHVGLPNSMCADRNHSARPPLDLPLARKTWIDSDYTDETLSPKVRNGVKMGEGDGTVSILSLGAMCVEGWNRRRWNPAGIKITTVELPHKPDPSSPRGGANTSDHVDILGSTRVNEIILKVAAGAGHEIEDSFVSNIEEYAKRIQWD